MSARRGFDRKVWDRSGVGVAHCEAVTGGGVRAVVWDLSTRSWADRSLPGTHTGTRSRSGMAAALTTGAGTRLINCECLCLGFAGTGIVALDLRLVLCDDVACIAWRCLCGGAAPSAFAVLRSPARFKWKHPASGIHVCRKGISDAREEMAKDE